MHYPRTSAGSNVSSEGKAIELWPLSPQVAGIHGHDWLRAPCRTAQAVQPAFLQDNACGCSTSANRKCLFGGRTCVIIYLLVFLFGETQDLGQKNINVWAGRGSRLVKELIHFLRPNPVKSPLHGAGRI